MNCKYECMRKVLKPKVLYIAVLFVLITTNAIGGWVITEESSDKFNNKQIQTIFIEGNLIRYETPTSIAIIDLDSSKITMIFSQYKVYWKGTAEELRLSSVEAYDAQLENLLAGIPEYKRKELDSVYKEIRSQLLDTVRIKSVVEISISETDKIDTIHDFLVNEYHIYHDSSLVESIWHTDEISPYQNIEVEKMVEFMTQLNAFTTQGTLTSSEEYNRFLRNGLIIKSSEYVGENIIYNTIVTNVREVNIIREFFEPPRNYRAAKLRDIFNMIPIEENTDNKWE